MVEHFFNWLYSKGIGILELYCPIIYIMLNTLEKYKWYKCVQILNLNGQMDKICPNKKPQ